MLDRVKFDNSVNTVNETNKKDNKSNPVNNNIKNNTNNGNDTFENSNKQDKKSIFDGIKDGIGVVGTFYEECLNKLYKKCGLMPEFKNNMPEHIDFKEAKSLGEAFKFGQEILGIEDYKGFERQDLDVVNWINEGLVRVNNAAKGNVIMPKNILFRDMPIDVDAQITGWGNMTVNRSNTNMLKTHFAQHGSNYKEQRIYLEKFCQERADNGGIIRYMGAFSDISHEMGHYQHNAKLGFSYNLLQLFAKYHIKIPILFRKELDELTETFEKSKNLADKVSQYAKKSPAEFVAECYSKMVDGIKLDDDVMDLYKKLGGATL